MKKVLVIAVVFCSILMLLSCKSNVRTGNTEVSRNNIAGAAGACYDSDEVVMSESAGAAGTVSNTNQEVYYYDVGAAVQCNVPNKL